MLRVRVVPAEGDPFDHACSDDEVVVGRDPACGIQVGDRFLSRRHARIARTDAGWSVEDLGSHNGTEVNDRSIEGPRVLTAGDRIRVSGTVIQVLATDASEELDATSEHTLFRRALDLIGHADDAIDSAVTVEDLRRRGERLQTLNAVHRALAATVETEDLLRVILDAVFEELNPEEAAVILADDGGGYRRVAERLGPGLSQAAPISSTLAAEVIEKGLGALALDVPHDERFGDAESLLASGVRSLVAAPLLGPDGALGMIAASSRIQQRRFELDDLELLASLASVSALHLRNVALAHEAAERRRLEEELELARGIQLGLLPKSLPDLDGWSMHGRAIPSRGVSGDFYQAMSRNEGRECALMIVDVSGKGITAALLTASLEALTAGDVAGDGTPAATFEAVNRRLFERTPPAKYATAFLAVLDTESGLLRYANAGHNPAFVLRAGGGIETLGSTGTPIGLLPTAHFEEAAVTLSAGDLFVLYTDGWTEPCNREEEEFGEERLAALCSNHRKESLVELTSTIEAALDEFVDGVPFPDDRTMLLLRRDS